MTIRQISLNDFRNLRSTTLDLHHQFNIITGLNASGKTSFLEALHIICQGNSFKTHLLNQCIQHNKQNFLLFSKFDDYKAGISRFNSKTIIRIDNETIHKVSLLAKKTPVKIINSSSFDLILGAPSNRREFIDWCLFHVEHSYITLFNEYSHALKQRNALLKSRKNLNELDYWDSFIADKCERIYKLRRDIIEIINKIMNNSFKEYLLEHPVEIKYIPGWDVKKSFINTLKKNREADIKFGFTRNGIHRDDLKFISNGYDIQTMFSRGQIKKISMFLILSQLILLNKTFEKKAILLIDDITSELDQLSIDYILQKLTTINLQLFITNINFDKKLFKHNEEFKLFHVEHGMIKAVKN